VWEGEGAQDGSLRAVELPHWAASVNVQMASGDAGRPSKFAKGSRAPDAPDDASWRMLRTLLLAEDMTVTEIDPDNMSTLAGLEHGTAVAYPFWFGPGELWLLHHGIVVMDAAGRSTVLDVSSGRDVALQSSSLRDWFPRGTRRALSYSPKSATSETRRAAADQACRALEYVHSDAVGGALDVWRTYGPRKAEDDSGELEVAIHVCDSFVHWCFTGDVSSYQSTPLVIYMSVKFVATVVGAVKKKS
jgi:hypothetical protein